MPGAEPELAEPAGSDARATAAFYESLWQGGADAENAARWTFQEKLVARAFARLGHVAGRVVLEIGPGPGRESARLAADGARVVAVDFARQALLRTRATSAGAVAAVQAAAEALPLKAASVDLIFAQTVLMHLDLERAAAEWARVLRPGGRVVVLEPLASNPLVGLYRRLCSPYRSTRPRYLTLEALAGASARLRLARHEEHYLLSVVVLALPRALARPLGALLAPLDRWLLGLPGLGRFGWMTLAELELVV